MSVQVAMVALALYQPWARPGRDNARAQSLSVFEVGVAEPANETGRTSLTPAALDQPSRADRQAAPAPASGIAYLPRGTAALPATGADAPAVAAVGAPSSGMLMQAYQDAVRAHVARYIFYPDSGRSERLGGVVHLRLELARDGRVTSVWIEGSSGYDSLDEAALTVIHRAEPMPAIPPSLPSELDIALPLDFVPPRLATVPAGPAVPNG